MVPATAEEADVVGVADVARGVVLDGRYRIEDVIGQGGMATVYRARDEVLNRDVAVKLFPPTPDADEVQRHQSEMHVLARLSHPNLVMLHDAGSTQVGGPLQQTYLVMELVPGPTLADLLGGGPLSARHTAKIGRQLAEALTTVHAAGVVHRDIKPANVLLVERETAVRESPDATLTTGPVVKIADFGIARFADGARLTVTGTTLGTATYLSPEQASGGVVGPPTDVYALGLVLLECLTGVKAFTGTVVEVAAARLNSDPPVPEGLDPEWVALVRAMTARDPAARPTMGETAARLSEMDGGALTTGEMPTARVVPPRVGAEPTRPYSTASLTAVAGAAGPGAGESTEATVPARLPVAGRGGPAARPSTVNAAPATGPAVHHDVPRPAAAAEAVPAPLAASPAPETSGGEDRAGRRRLAALGVAALVLLGVTVTVVQRDDGPPEPPPALPAVDGPLGDALDDLYRSVQP